MRYGRIGLALLLSGCGSGPGHDEAVRDAGPPLPAVTDSLLFGVRDVVAGAAGDIWIISRHDPFIRRYTADGRRIASFGRQGQGPGEFIAPWSFVRGDRRAPPRVFDPGGRLILRLDSAGIELARTSFRTTWGFVRSDIEDVSYGQVFRAYAPSDSELVSLVYLGDVGTTRDLRRSALVRFTALGVARDTLVSFRSLFEPQTDRTAARWLVTIPLTAGCPDGTVAVFDGIAPEIRGYARGPEPVWRVGFPARMDRARAMPAADIERYVRYRVLGELLENGTDTSALERRVGEQLRSDKSWYAPIVPPTVALLCDGRNRVWLQEFDTRDDPLGKGRIWTVIGRRGGSARVRVPLGFALLGFRPAELIGVVRDSLGVEMVATSALPGAISRVP